MTYDKYVTDNNLAHTRNFKSIVTYAPKQYSTRKKSIQQRSEKVVLFFKNVLGKDFISYIPGNKKAKTKATLTFNCSSCKCITTIRADYFKTTKRTTCSICYTKEK